MSMHRSLIIGLITIGTVVLGIAAVAPPATSAAEPAPPADLVQPAAFETSPGCANDASAPCCEGSLCCDKCKTCRKSKYVCCCTTKQQTVEKDCWRVKCEAVCIPPICLPKCLRLFCKCGPCSKCKVRCVRVLESDSYEVDECTCEWEARCQCACGTCAECCDTCEK